MFVQATEKIGIAPHLVRYVLALRHVKYPVYPTNVVFTGSQNPWVMIPEQKLNDFASVQFSKS